jgi:amidase
VTELCWTPARQLAAAIADRSLSAIEVMEAHLARIAEVNPRVNAIVTLDEEFARAGARATDEAVARGDELGPLHGLPIAVKDLEDTAGMRTTYGSTIFADHVPDKDSLVVERLRRAGAIVIGKTNTPEFGAGSNTFNRVFGATRNPLDDSLTPGGSSGGAAAAVASGMLPFADGSDLASSLRNPASFCGVVGLRPSPGRIPSADAESDPWASLSVIGSIARSVDDAALLLGALAGRDPRDPKSVAAPPDALDPIVPARLDSLRIAWSRNLGDLPVAAAVTAVLEPRREQLAAQGAHVSDAEPDLRAADFVFDTLRAVGFASLAPLLEKHPGELKDSVVWNVRKGLALSGGDIARASAARGGAYAAMQTFLESYDVLALPTAQVVPFPVEQEWVEEIDGVAMEHYVAWLRTCSRITVTGHPAISIPAGLTADGLPVGLQLVGRHLEERRLLEVAAAFEAAFSPSTPGR